jgi:hypothetical protein
VRPWRRLRAHLSGDVLVPSGPTRSRGDLSPAAGSRQQAASVGSGGAAARRGGAHLALPAGGAPLPGEAARPAGRRRAARRPAPRPRLHRRGAARADRHPLRRRSGGRGAAGHPHGGAASAQARLPDAVSPRRATRGPRIHGRLRGGERRPDRPGRRPLRVGLLPHARERRAGRGEPDAASPGRARLLPLARGRVPGPADRRLRGRGLALREPGDRGAPGDQHGRPAAGGARQGARSVPAAPGQPRLPASAREASTTSITPP